MRLPWAKTWRESGVIDFVCTTGVLRAGQAVKEGRGRLPLAPMKDGTKDRLTRRDFSFGLWPCVTIKYLAITLPACLPGYCLFQQMR
jgi:hypothetical protein